MTRTRNHLRDTYTQRYQLSRSQLRDLTLEKLEQLERCSDEPARRLLLGLPPRPDWEEIACPISHCRAFLWGDLQVLVGLATEGGWKRWHLSISHPSRYPTWQEIRFARYDLLPHDVTMAMILPPHAEYVSLHQNCFHLHQIPDDGENSLA